MVEKLGTGDVFPSLSLKVAGGGTINLPEGLNKPLTVVLFYRGYW